jgi:tripartite-type tricarboxylate transporter receptor subunit TctC
MIVPFAPGGLTDVIGRLLAEGMRKSLGQPIIIENVGGADGSIGTGRVARAAPDGYTLVVGIWNTHVGNGATRDLKYDVVTDFEPIALLADAPLVLTAKRGMPASNLKEFLTWLKVNPEKASMGTTGAGGPNEVVSILLQQETGARFVFVPYRGAGPLVQGLAGGQVDVSFLNPATALPQVRAGSIKAFAVTAKSRLAIAPDIPSVDEAGLPGLYFSLWAGLFAPRGTSKDVIAKLNAAAMSGLSDPSIREKVIAQGFELPRSEQMAPGALGALQKAEIEKWWPIIKAAGIKAE